jgi:2-oxoglutarate ferredoxin oxidoreductase subunit alpha
MKGNEAVAEAAIQAGCRHFFGYPITPQSELPEYMARRMPEVGGVFVQSESEVATINMLYGAGGAGARVMTSSSSPGIALMQEGISYMAGAEVPGVIVNMMRGGPGLGDIQPSQGDYFQATRGGGNGDYHVLVYAPASLQEMVDMMQYAFDAAEHYRNPVMVLGDGMLGQMMEPVEFGRPGARKLEIGSKDWCTNGIKNHPGKRNVINSLDLDPEKLEEHNEALQAKYAVMAKDEQMADLYNCDGADVIVVAYGTTSRVVRTAIRDAKDAGIKLGLIRPISLWPFPDRSFESVVNTPKAFLVVEMSHGQMVQDVRLAVNGRKPVYFYGRSGGMVPTAEGIVKKVQQILAEVK